MKIWSVTLCLAGGLSCLACNSKSDSDVNGIGLQKTAFSSNVIEVCWENRSQADLELKHLRSEIQRFVGSEFARTVVRMTGWADCKNPTPQKNEVRFTWWDSGEAPHALVDGQSQIGNGSIYGPRLKALSQRLKSDVRAAPTLAMNSEAWREWLNLRKQDVALADLKSKVLHEFGHAVGLLHEHVRTDSTCDKKETLEMHLKYWRDSDVGLAAVMKSIVGTKNFDESSVMNYCRIEDFQATGKVVGFSAGDIQTINLLYAGPPKANSAPVGIGTSLPK